MGLFGNRKSKQDRMGLFGNKKSKQEMIVINGYVIGKDDRIIYHCPQGRTEYVLPEGAESISNEAWFDMAPTMVSLRIPTSMTFVARTIPSIRSAKNLKNIELADGITAVDLGLELIKNAKFNIPKSISHLNAGVYTTSPEGKVVIGDNIKSIDSLFASHDCGIRELEIMGGIDTISDQAFNQCKNLQRVIIHQGVKNCGREAFRGTNSLEYLEIPEGFSGPLQAEVDLRPGESTRGGKFSSYDLDKDNIKERKLTIKVGYKGKQFSFEIKREQFGQIDIQEGRVLINGRVSISLSELDDRATHKIDEQGKVSHELPKDIRDEERLRKFRESTGIRGTTPAPQPRPTPAPAPQPRPEQPKPKITRESLAKYDLRVVNKLISQLLPDSVSAPSALLSIAEEELRNEGHLYSTERAVLEWAIRVKQIILANKKDPSAQMEAKKIGDMLTDLENEGEVEGFEAQLRRANREREIRQVGDFKQFELAMEDLEKKMGLEM